MNYNKKNSQYYNQLENGIAEMEATVERLRTEINELMEMKNALNQLNCLLKKELKELIGENHF
jgi:prefoldin subunit 5